MRRFEPTLSHPIPPCRTGGATHCRPSTLRLPPFLPSPSKQQTMPFFGDLGKKAESLLETGRDNDHFFDSTKVALKTKASNGAVRSGSRKNNGG